MYAISLTTLILCIIYLVWDWRKNRKKRIEDDAPMEETPAHKSIIEYVSAFMQGFGRKKEWVAPGQKEGAHEKIAGGFRALKKEYAQKTAEKRELWEIKDYFRERKERPKYRFVAPPKPMFTRKEVDSKMDDIKKRLMLRDKGEDR